MLIGKVETETVQWLKWIGAHIIYVYLVLIISKVKNWHVGEKKKSKHECEGFQRSKDIKDWVETPSERMTEVER